MSKGKTGLIRKVSIDQVVALALLPVILIILAILYCIVVPLQGRPFFFSARRMRGPVDTFVQHKIRTMQPVDRFVEQAIMGGDLQHRITPIGAFLRKSRLDELPQIINVLRGDMAFIGPRPQLQKYVENNPAYAKIMLQTLPGVTGLATVLLHAREDRILSRCKNAAETDKAYREHCIPLKIRMEELYLRRKSMRLNLFILWKTISGLGITDAVKGLIVPIWNAPKRNTTVLSRSSHGLSAQAARNVGLK